MVIQRFEDEVRCHPDHYAIRGKDVHLTYAQLNRKANRVARKILEKCHTKYHLSERELTRYKRQLFLDGWGIESQEKLKGTTVFVAGAGGSGSPLIMQLALVGFGTLRVCDFDEVDLSNLNRQALHDESRLGMNKAISAQLTIGAMNPHVTVVPLTDRITRDNVDTLVGDSLIIFDNVDDLETKFILSECAVRKGIPHIISSMIDLNSYAVIFYPPYSPCFHCLYDRDKLTEIAGMQALVEDYEKTPNPVASPSLFLSTGFVVNEAIKIVLGFENPAYNRYFLFNQKGSKEIVHTDGHLIITYPFSEHFRRISREQGFDWDEGWRGQFVEELEITPDPECPLCHEIYEQAKAGSCECAEELVDDFEFYQAETTPQRVGLLFEHGPDMIVGVLAALKAGKAYIPLDPAYPEERLKYMLEDSGATLLVTNQQNLLLVKRLTGRVKNYLKILNIDTMELKIPDTDLSLPVPDDQMAYILYTSGSTGIPKGVVQTRGNVEYFVQNYITNFGLTSADRMTLFSTFTHDAAVMDIYSGLLAGATLYPVNIKEQTSVGELAAWLREEEITIWHSVPTVFRYFYRTLEGREELLALRYIILGGEAVLENDVEMYKRYFGSHTTLANLYGQTESSYNATQFFGHDTPYEKVTLGEMVEGTEIFVINDEGEEVLPFEIGEIIVANNHVAQGYWQDEARTERVFKNHPDLGWLYRTGDLGRPLLDGRVEFVGRKDFQVKVRGYRIELGEIESKLATHPAVRDSAVIAKASPEGEYFLRAFLVLKEEVNPGEIRQFLLKKLPDYMVPADYVVLEQLPLTGTNKTDRKALQELEGFCSLKRDYLPPTNPVEEQLVEIWGQILGRERIGIEDDFFTLGGNSLKATLLLAEVYKALGVNLSLRVIFECPTVQGLAGRLARETREQYARIPRVEPAEHYPLSSAQKRILLLQEMAGTTTSYNISTAFWVVGPLERNRLEAAFRKVISRFEVLRTSFTFVGGEPCQVVHDEVEFMLEELTCPEREVDAQVVREFVRPFDLQCAPLLRAGLMKLARERYLLVYDLHHIIADGMSLNLLIQEMSNIYVGIELPEPAIHYKDFAIWQNRFLQSGAMDRQKAYWVEQFAGELPVLDLPTDWPRLAVRDLAGERVEVTLHRNLTDKLNQLALAQNATLYMVLLAGFTILLARYSGEEDLIVGTPQAGRTHPELANAIGMFVNTLALRNQPALQKTFTDYLGEVRANTLQAFENGDYQFELLVEDLRLPADQSRNPLFDVMFVLQNMEQAQNAWGSLQFQPYEITERMAKFDLTLAALEVPQGLTLSLEYACSLFKRETAERMLAHLKNILTAIADTPEVLLGEIQLMSAEEKEQLLWKWNQTAVSYPVEKSVHHLFEEQALRTPDLVAVEEGVRTITYRELNQRASTLAAYLRERGIGKEQIVAVMLKPSLEVVVSLLAILKAQGAYLPIDPELPSGRIAYMLRDSGARLLLTDRQGVAQTQAADGRNMLVIRACDLTVEEEQARGEIASADESSLSQQREGAAGDGVGQLPLAGKVGAEVDGVSQQPLWNEIGSADESQAKTSTTYEIIDVTNLALYAGESPVPFSTPADPASLAYLIYTSGSTGNPKGVLIEHRGLTNYLCWAQKVYLTGRRGDFPLYSSLSFDLTVTSLYLPLISGFRVIVYAGLGVDPVQRIVAENRVEIMKLTPAHLQILVSLDLHNSSLTGLIVGGEDLKRELAEEVVHKLQGRVAIYNEYGPTETVVGCMIHRFDPASDQGYSVPVGVPADNVQIYLLDQQQNPVPAGVVGEMYISGDGVARGYLNRPELTASRFLPNPFLPGQRMYRTGDRARMLPGGKLEFWGRIDDQVKIRGYRIELGEIENQLLQSGLVEEAVVLKMTRPTGDPYLCAYCVPVHDGAELRQSGDQEDLMAALRARLQTKLPRYMVPDSIILLDAMPLTRNGKIDRRKLAEISSFAVVHHYVPPRDQWDEELALLYAQILGVEQVGIEDDFLALGGHSLHALRLVSQIYQTLEYEVQVHEIFAYPTIRQLADYLREKQRGGYAQIRLAEKREIYPVSSAQKRIYALWNLLDKDSVAYNMPGAVWIDGALDLTRLKTTFNRLVERHETLRTSFSVCDGEPCQRVHPAGAVAIELATAVQADEVEAEVSCFIRPFDLAVAPLFRVKVLEMAEGETGSRFLLLYDLHHIIADGLSLERLITEFGQLYAGEELAPLRIQYTDFALWQNEILQSEAVREQERFWLETFQGEIPVLHLSADLTSPGVRPEVRSFAGASVRFALDRELTAALRKVGCEKGMTLYMVLLAAYNLLLSKYTGDEDIIIGTPVAGRNHPELELLIGMFVNTLALRNQPLGSMTVAEFLAHLRQNTLQAFSNQDYPFELLVEQLKLERDFSRNPLFDTVFALEMAKLAPAAALGVQMTPYEFSGRTAKFDLTLTGVDRGDMVELELVYNRQMFSAALMTRMAAHYQQAARLIVDLPEVSLRDLTILLPEERESLLHEFNQSAREYPLAQVVQQLVEAQAAQRPDHTAVVHEGNTLTYQQLNEQANRLAWLLRSKRTGREKVVAIMVESSLCMPAAILGVLKAGGAYLPIDPLYPAERISYMLKDSGCKLVLTQSKLITPEMTSFEGEMLAFEEIDLTVGEGANLEIINTPEDLAYVIYTSGSTGRPKGVMVEHHSLLNLIFWHNEYYQVTAADRSTKYAGFGFDASVWEIFPYLAAGATLHIISEELKLDLDRLNRYYMDQGITISFLPTQLAGQFMHLKNSLLRVLLTGGDQLHTYSPTPYRLYNNYGPTENTVVTTAFLVDGTYANIPIGRPVANTRLYVVDHSGHLQPLGVPGELWIAGEGLARGYIGNPQLTAEKFGDSGFLPGERVYKTGDLVRWRTGGTLEFLGRVDEQVKIRGYRIEPGEIVAGLLTHPAVAEAAVIAREDETGAKYLTAYYVTRDMQNALWAEDDGTRSSAVNAAIQGQTSDERLVLAGHTAKANPLQAHEEAMRIEVMHGEAMHEEAIREELRMHLASRLPAYMIPVFFVALDRLPLTPNGKLDRKALPVPQQVTVSPHREDGPRTPVQEALARVWGEVLGVPVVGLQDHFFDLGGDSIKAINLAARLQRYGYKLEVRDLMRYPTISAVAEHVTTLLHEADQGTVTGPVPLTPVQHWFVNSDFADHSQFIHIVMLESEVGFDPVALEAVTRKIVEHHDALRMVYAFDGTGIMQQNRGLDGQLFSLEVIDTQHTPNLEVRMEEVAARIYASFNLATGPLVKLALFQTEMCDYLLIAIHHLVVDGISWRILLEDLERGYQQALQKEEIHFQAKTASFRDWANFLQQYANSRQIKQELAYWQKVDAEVVESLLVHQSGTDGAPMAVGRFVHPAGKVSATTHSFVGSSNVSVSPTGTTPFPVANGVESRSLSTNASSRTSTKTTHASVTVTLSLDETSALLQASNRAYNTEINDLLLAALARAVGEWTGVQKLAVTLESHGRHKLESYWEDSPDISRAIGWFTTTYPVVLDLTEASTLAASIKQVKEILRRVPNHGSGYGVLKYLSPDAPEFQLQPEISFNYLGQFGGTTDLAQVFRFSQRGVVAPLLEGNWQHPLTINGLTANGELVLTINYHTALFSTASVEELAKCYRAALLKVCEHCQQVETPEATPSDYGELELSVADLNNVRCHIAGLGEELEVHGMYLLSPMQQGMLFHSLYSKSEAYFEQATITLTGCMDAEILRTALAGIIDRYDILRAIFLTNLSTGLRQVIIKGRKPELTCVDLSQWMEEEQTEHLQQLKQADRARGFDLARDLLIRLTAVQLGAERFTLIWSFHHIIMDGWCLSIILQEFLETYQAEVEGRKPVLMPPTSYGRYLNWLKRQDPEEARAYWQQALLGYEEQAVIPHTAQANAGEYRFTETRFTLSEELRGKLQQLARREQVTVNTVMQTVWGILLHRYNNTADVVFGTVVSGRPAEVPGIEQMVGLFINTIPVRVQRGAGITFARLLRVMQEQAIQAEPYHYVPLADIQVQTPLKNRLIQHLVIMENYPVEEEMKEAATGAKRPFEISNVEIFAQVNYNFTTIFSPEKQFKVKFKYNSHVYDDAFVRQIMGHLEQILSQVVEDANLPVEALELITATERKQLLYDWNQTARQYPANQTMHQIFEAQAARTPEQIALLYADQTMTYQELNTCANQLARHLQKLGVKPGVVVGLCVERSFAMITAIWAILKAGGAYLPLDTKNPQERTDYMLTDAGAEVLLTVGDLASKTTFAGVIIDLADEQVYRGDSSNLDVGVHSNDLIYVIYTSGSTGKPKGVMLEHRQVINTISHLQHCFPVNGADTIMQSTVYTFDASAREIFWFFFGGARLCLLTPEAEKSLHKILQTIQSAKVTLMKFVPLLLSELLNLALELKPAEGNLLSSLRYILCGGDALPGSTMDKYFQLFGESAVDRVFANIYGPTEAALNCTDYVVERPVQRFYVPIGRPISNMQMYILDQALRPQPVGVPGELYIAGDGVARGYLNRPELTAERFLADPFVPGNRMYRSGDLCRYLPDGNIEFMGRLDFQIKIRGLRVELGEIEAQLQKHPGIRETLVIARKDATGSQYLTAYVVLHHAEMQEDALTAELKAHLAKGLPDYMIPVYFIYLASMPVLPSGKVNRAALPEPGHDLSGSREYVAPGNWVEERLTRIWQEVLGVEQIGVTENFFDLGGHSLRAMVVSSRVYRETGVELPVKEIFSKPTIRAQAQYIAAGQEKPYSSIELVDGRDVGFGLGIYPLSSAQKRMFILHQMMGSTTAYNMPGAMLIDGKLDVVRLEAAFARLIQRHESLRTSFDVFKGEPVQLVLDRVAFSVEMVELADVLTATMTDEVMGGTRTGTTEVDSAEQTNAAHGVPRSQSENGVVLDAPSERAIALALKRFLNPFDLKKAPLFRVMLARLSAERYLVAFDLHHIISDGISMANLVSDFIRLYRGEELAELPVQYKDFAVWQQNLLVSREMQRQEEYWLSRFAGEIPVLDLPTDEPRPAVQSFAGDRFRFELSVESQVELNRLARQEGATLYMLLFATYQILLARYSGQDDMVIGSPVAGRSHPDLRPLIGFFVNTLAMRNTLAPREQSFSDFLATVKANALDAYDHQDYQFEMLIEKLNLPRNAGRNPLFDVMFALQNTDPATAQMEEGLRLTRYDLENRIAKFDLTLIGVESPQGITMTLEYSTQLFHRGTMERFRDHFLNLVKNILREPEQPIAYLEILSVEERKTLVEDWNATWTDYPREQSIAELWEEQVQRNPDQIALQWKGATMSYGELNRHANRLAQQLRAKGVGRDQIVGLMAERSAGMLIGIFAILKAGGAYLPLNPDDPAERIRYMLEDSQVSICLAHLQTVERLDFAGEIILLDDAAWSSDRTIEGYAPVSESASAEENLPLINEPGDLCYVIYTSGTTGRPKGNLTMHYNVTRVVKATNYIEITAADRLLQLSNYAFDGSVFDIYGALLNGASLVLIDRDTVRDPDQLAEAIEQAGVSVFFVTTALFNVLVDNNLPALSRVRKILFGGERVSVEHVRKAVSVLGADRVIHVYGPTESTVFATYYPVRQVALDATTIPIGAPLANTKVYIFDRWGRLQPVGVSGELCIAGEGLARGYLKRPELTAEKFVSNPLDPAETIYCTGDLARMLPDGNIEFLGRIDHQVKIRGFRVEPGEIEAQLLQDPGIAEAVVVDWPDSTGSKYLAAYLVTAPGIELDLTEVRSNLAEHLPGFMLPAHLVQVEALPLNANGKVDRRALPKLEGSAPHGSPQHCLPVSELEVRIARVWENVLGVKRVGLDDDFFALGGHSLKVISAMKMLNQELQSDYPLSLLFMHHTVRQLAESIVKAETLSQLESVVQLKAGSGKNLFVIHPLGGAIHWYQKLAEVLTNDFNIYGIQARGLMNNAPLPNTLQVMVEEYLKEIRQIQPAGPYYIAAYCAGSMLAYELTLQLMAQGETVARCIMLDSPAFRIGGKVGGQVYALKRYWKKLKLQVRKQANMLRANTGKAQPNADRISTGVALRQIEIEENLVDLMIQYRPAHQLEHDIYLLKASDNQDARISYEAWSRLVQGEVQVVPTPGDHTTMMEEPLVRDLAERLEKILE